MISPQTLVHSKKLILSIPFSELLLKWDLNWLTFLFRWVKWTVLCTIIIVTRMAVGACILGSNIIVNNSVVPQFNGSVYGLGIGLSSLGRQGYLDNYIQQYYINVSQILFLRFLVCWESGCCFSQLDTKHSKSAAWEKDRLKQSF